ncbi:hypothetical protein RJ639_047149, partial [Escallonia herrerae]
MNRYLAYMTGVEIILYRQKYGYFLTVFQFTQISPTITGPKHGLLLGGGPKLDGQLITHFKDKRLSWVAEDGMKMQHVNDGYNGSQLWDVAFSFQGILATNLADEYGSMLKKANSFIKVSQAALLLSRMPSDIIGQAITRDQLFDAVNFILSLQPSFPLSSFTCNLNRVEQDAVCLITLKTLLEVPCMRGKFFNAPEFEVSSTKKDENGMEILFETLAPQPVIRSPGSKSKMEETIGDEVLNQGDQTQ